jgi:hypothetical protein
MIQHIPQVDRPDIYDTRTVYTSQRNRLGQSLTYSLRVYFTIHYHFHTPA